ncbi:MAG: HAD family hydrolase [Nitrospirota bacterium]
MGVPRHAVPWDQVDDVLLDMDGTLLDRHFDNFFFEEELPRRYAAKHGLSFDEALTKLLALYRSVERELAWTDLHYWTRLLDIDLIALTREFDHLIGFHPDAVEFLEFLRARGKRVHIITNAHESGIRIKVAKTGVDRHVDRIVNAFEVGYLKMREEYWPACRRLIGFDPARALYVDDDEACLAAAREFGVGHIYHRSKSSSRLPPQPSSRYPSIESFRVFMAG